MFWGGGVGDLIEALVACPGFDWIKFYGIYIVELGSFIFIKLSLVGLSLAGIIFLMYIKLSLMGLSLARLIF